MCFMIDTIETGSGMAIENEVAASKNRTAKTPKHPLAVLVGKRLREKREARGYTLNAVAETLNFDRQTISTWENGFAFPPIPKLLALCRLYQCSTDEIVKGEEPDSWEGVAALMPVDLREKTLIIHNRPEVGELVPALNNMTSEQLARLKVLLPQLALVGDAGMDAIEKIIAGLAEVIAVASGSSKS